MGTKSGRIEWGCDLEKLWIGPSKGKETRSIRYFVRKEIENDRELAIEGFIFAHINAVETGDG